MTRSASLPAGNARATGRTKSTWPARLDVLQSASGLALALFMWGHMFFVASILLGKEAMWTVTKFFEGYYFLGEAHPWIVSVVVAGVIALFAVHAALALRKFPATYAQYQALNDHVRGMRHADTTLWRWQVITGFALFFLALPHLYIMLTQPGSIGPYGSADRVWSDGMWGLYLLLLLAVEIHGGVGLYRLAVKWGWLGSGEAARRRLKVFKWLLTAFFIVLGLATLAAYATIGMEHADRYGERFVPAAGNAP